MGLRDTYAYAIQQAQGKFDGSAQEREGAEGREEQVEP